ncbi:MAG TPA: tetratricopeptide repeat protein [Planctomycetota bacterium]|nr:tetratricopeptide repeat protein [Planctomycetota bacterium]
MIDLRVEDDPAPLDELARLLRLRRAYDHMDAGDLAVEHGDMDGAAREYGAAQTLVPEVYEIAFWAGIMLAGKGRLDEARPLLKQALTAYPRLAGLIPRLPAAGLLPDDPALVKELSGLVP